MQSQSRTMRFPVMSCTRRQLRVAAAAAIATVAMGATAHANELLQDCLQAKSSIDPKIAALSEIQVMSTDDIGKRCHAFVAAAHDVLNVSMASTPYSADYNKQVQACVDSMTGELIDAEKKMALAVDCRDDILREGTLMQLFIYGPQ